MAKFRLQIYMLLLLCPSTILAQEDRIGESCNLASTGGPGKESFLAFDRELRVALSKQDPASKDIQGTGPCAHPVWRFIKGDTEVTVSTGGCYPDSSSPPEGATGSLEISVSGQTGHWWCF